MIDKRTNLGKIIDKDLCVFGCILCGYKFIGSIEDKDTKCPKCPKEVGDTIVIVSNFSVIDKGA